MAWPTTNDPRTEFATMRMTETEDADLDWGCRLLGVSRSEFLRDASAEKIERLRRAERRAQKKGGS